QVKTRIEKITDLRQDLVQIFCKYLSAVDMVNVCTAIPNWEWILFLPASYSFMNKWKWIDRRVYAILLSDLPVQRTARICKAVEQHFNQMEK
ncbi:hypothetical protein TSMEX_002658, partial [Taenia solium]